MERKYDVIIIGGGPGGYVAAIRLAQLGKKVALVEEKWIGGVCLNVGCIPTKALLEVTEVKEKIEKFKGKGVEVAEVKFNLADILKWKSQVVKKLTKGVEFLLKKNGVEIYMGRGELEDNNCVRVKGEKLCAENIIIATGSKPRELPVLPFSEEKIMDSEEVLSPAMIPESMLIVGGGVIGVEMATIYSRLGTRVQIVEMLPEILPGFDEEARKLVRRYLERKGIKIYTNALVEKYEDGKAIVQKGDGEIEIETDKILVSCGRVPNSEEFKPLGIATDRGGFIVVDSDYRTNIPSIYAIGDVIGGPLLAHKAHREGVEVAEIIAGKKMEKPRVIPSVVYGSIEIAKCGMTEEEAKEKGYKVKVGKFPFQANGRAATMGVAEGFVKVIGDERTEEVLGIHMVGPHASELAISFCIAIENRLKVKEIAHVVHPHPTLSEALMEACENFYRRAIHIINQ